MKKLIVYSTKCGASFKCANTLNALIPDSEAVNITMTTPDLSDYGAVIIGGGVYAGRTDKKLRRFIKNNHEKIASMPHGFFVCCSDADYMKMLAPNFPKDLVDSAVAVDGFGSLLESDHAKGFLKFILKSLKNMYLKNNQELPCVNEEKVAAFAEKFK